MARKPTKKSAKKIAKKKVVKTRAAAKGVRKSTKKAGRPAAKKKAVAESGRKAGGVKYRVRKRFSEDQIKKMLREADARGSAAAVIEKYGISKSSFYAWRQKLGTSASA